MKPTILLSLLMIVPPPGRAQGVDAAIGLYEHGKFQAAADILAGLIRQNSKDSNLRIWQGKTFIKLHRWDEAIRELEQAVELNPKSGLSHLWLGRAEGYKADHSTLSAFGWARKTVKEFETAAQLSPDNIDIRFDLVEFYSQAPGIVGGGRNKAEAQAGEIARLSPRLGHTARAVIHENDKEWDQANQELTQATLKFPNVPKGFSDLAEFLLERGQYAPAEAAAQKAVALDPSIRKARLDLAAAQIELHRGGPDTLKVLLDLAAGPLTDNDPAFEEVYYWLGRAYMAQGQKAEARQAFLTSLGFDSDYSRSKQALGQIR